jgi:hypothetical protein
MALTTKDLATYYDTAKITTVKSFIVQAPDITYTTSFISGEREALRKLGININ